MATTITHLIVAGTTKAATTSLFEYLSAHPQICASTRKESRFFLDPDYPVPLREHHVDEGIDRYDAFFSGCAERPIRLEATPDYLYSPGTPAWIAALPGARPLFVLRDPVERLLSWYHFARQNNDLGDGTTLRDYVERQLRPGGDPPPRQQAWMALEQGRYLHYLRPWFERFGAEGVFLLDYRGLVEEPTEALIAICDWLGIDGGLYRDFDFRVYNRTVGVRSPRLHELYQGGKRRLRRALPHGRLRGALKRLLRLSEPVLLRVNLGAKANEELPPELLAELADYYAPERAWLRRSGLRLSWPDQGAGRDSPAPEPSR